MTSDSFFLLYLIFFTLELLTLYVLNVLNMNSVLKNRKTVPQGFEEAITKEDYRNSIAYSLRKEKFVILSSFISSGATLLIIFSGLLGDIDLYLKQWNLGSSLHGIIYIGIMTLIFSLVTFPLSFYSRFVIEEEFGFNKTSAKLYFIDTFKGLILTAVLGIPLLLLLFLFMDSTGDFWWLWAMGAITLFQFIMLIIYPTLIAPLFNKFTPLEEGPLKERLETLAEKTGFTLKGLFVVDGSRRSGHSNAYFTGIGKAKRIVLYDTLIEYHSEEELEAILAHEIGHYKMKHIKKRLILSILSLGVSLFIMSLALKWPPLFEAFGMEGPSYHGLFVLISFVSGPFTFFLSPVGNILSRKHEYEADNFAKKITGTCEPMITALVNLSRKNLSNLTPHKAYSFYHYSHPTAGERIASLKED